MPRVCHLLRQVKYRTPVLLVPSRHHSIEKEPLKTSVTFLTDDKQEQTQGKFIPPYVTRYSTQGFRVQNTKVFGSVAILPEVFYHWKVNRAEDITPESLALFTVMEPPIEILVIGTGDKLVRLKPEVSEYLREKRLAVEVQDTRNAAATFNFLLEEERVVGAALIPPAKLPDD